MPTAGPLTAASTGLGRSRTAAMIGLKRSRRGVPTSGAPPGVAVEAGLQVRAGGERPAGAGDGHGAHGVVAGGELEGGQQVVARDAVFQAFSRSGRSSTIRSSPPLDAPRRRLTVSSAGSARGHGAAS